MCSCFTVEETEAAVRTDRHRHGEKHAQLHTEGSSKTRNRTQELPPKQLEVLFFVSALSGVFFEGVTDKRPPLSRKTVPSRGTSAILSGRHSALCGVQLCCSCSLAHLYDRLCFPPLTWRSRSSKTRESRRRGMSAEPQSP